MGQVAVGVTGGRHPFVRLEQRGDAGVEPARVDVAGGVDLLEELGGPVLGVLAHDLASGLPAGTWTG
jgi:hypothetical protein